jgi:hypothetical protein
VNIITFFKGQKNQGKKKGIKEEAKGCPSFGLILFLIKRWMTCYFIY